MITVAKALLLTIKFSELRELCDRKQMEIIEAYAMPDCIHMLVSIPPNEKVSKFMRYLKGKSTCNACLNRNNPNKNPNARAMK